MEIKIQNINELNIEEISKGVSIARLNRAAKFKNEIDRIRSISVEYLLNSMVKEIYPSVKLPLDIEYDEKGKPHSYNNDEEIHFSLSHSGDYVACMISDKPCGIDIERHSKSRDYDKVAKRICTEEELTGINSKTDFYNVWTLKESVLKAVGLGLSLDMKKIELKKVKECTFAENEGTKYQVTLDGIKYQGKILEAPDGYSLSYIEIV